jgi:hypothetical protein
MLCCSYYLLCFLFNRIGEQEGKTGPAWKPGGMRKERGKGPGCRGREVALTTYIHVSKCKNNKKGIL